MNDKNFLDCLYQNVFNNFKKIITIIVILAIVIRILFLDKSTGFWHNEMVMYNHAMSGNIIDIINTSVKADIHFPLYQIVLSQWIKIFGNGDITIRLFSVLGGVLNVMAAYFAGKEFKNEKTGNTFAFLCAINSVLIFYSQEVKFYIFLSLFVTLSLYFIIKIFKKSKLIYYIGYIICNLCIVYTFTIGILYVMAQGFSLLLYMIFNKREHIKNFLIVNFVLVLAVLPYIIFIFANVSRYRSVARIFTSNINTIFILIQNYFSPCIVGLYNNPEIYRLKINIISILFIIIPVILAFYTIYKSIRKNKSNMFILLIALIFLGFETILCLNSGFRMLTRYTIMAIPPLLLLVSIGICELKPKYAKIIIIYMLIINICYLVISPNSAIRGFRDIGEKPVTDFLIQNNISSDDVIVNVLRKDDYDKYLTLKIKKYSLLQDFIYKPYVHDYSSAIKNRYEAYWNYVKDTERISPEFEKDFYNNVIYPLKENGRIFYIWDDNYNTFPITDYDMYVKTPVMTAALSKINSDAYNVCNRYLKLKGGIILKYYKVFIFEK